MSVSKVAARVKLFLVNHHTSSVLCGKILTTPTLLLLEYGSSPMHIWKQKTQKAVI